MNRPNRNLVRWLSIFALMGVLGLLIWSKREPRFDGYSLGIWLDAASRCPVCDTNGVPADSFAVALRAMSPEAIPHLVSYLKRKESSRLRNQIQNWLDKLPGEPFQLPHRQNLAPVAAEAFWILGTNATDAIPRLARQLASESAEEWTIMALEGIGPAAIPTLSNAVSHPNPRLRLHAVQALATFGTNAASVQPWFQQLIHDPGTPVDLRNEMIATVAEFGPIDEATRQFLNERLHDSALGNGAAFALARTGKSGWLQLLNSVTNLSTTNELARIGAVRFGALYAPHQPNSPENSDSLGRYSFRPVRTGFGLGTIPLALISNKGRAQTYAVRTMTNFMGMCADDGDLLSSGLATLERVGDSNRLSTDYLSFLAESHPSESIRTKAAALKQTFSAQSAIP